MKTRKQSAHAEQFRRPHDSEEPQTMGKQSENWDDWRSSFGNRLRSLEVKFNLNAPLLKEDREEELLEKVRLGDEAAKLNLLWEGIYPTCGRFILSRANELTVDEVKDLIQTVSLKALENIGTFERKCQARLSSWLYKICENALIDHWRKKERELTGAETDSSDEAVDQAKPVIARLIEAEDVERVSRAIAQLRPQYRKVVRMFYFEGKQYKEIADALNLPEGTVAGYLSRAKVEIEDFLKKTA